MKPTWNSKTLKLLDETIEADLSKYKDLICEKELYSELAMIHKSKFNYKIKRKDITTQDELIDGLKRYKKEIE